MKFLALVFLFSQFCFSEPVSDIEIEALIREGKTDVALAKIEASELTVSVKSKLKGILNLKKGQFAKAAEYFSVYLVDAPGDKRVRTFLIQALMQNKSYSEAESELSKTPEKERDAKWSLLYSMSLWEKGAQQEALNFLNTAKSKYSSVLIPRQIYYFLSQLGLFKPLIKSAEKDISSKFYPSSLGVYVVKLLKESKLYDQADRFFEFLSALYPRNSDILKERGIYEIERKRVTSGAEFFARAATLDRKYAFEAAEALLRIGNTSRALYFNGKIEDPKKKTTQLFSIYVQSQEFEKAGGLYYNLVKTGSLENQKVAYALSYVGFKLRDFDLFDKVFGKVTDPSLYSKALVLKKKVEQCRQSQESQCEFI